MDTVKVLGAVLVIAVGSIPNSHGQSARLVFGVASIKPTQAAPGSASGIQSVPGRMIGRNVTAEAMYPWGIRHTGNAHLRGTKVGDEDRYEIDAKAAGPTGDHDMMVMLQSLLSERFHLVSTANRSRCPVTRWWLRKASQSRTLLEVDRGKNVHKSGEY